MVDIAASLSLTSAGSVADPAAVLGAETADNQAFGNILAGRMAGQAGAAPDAAAPAGPLPTLPLPAGNRQPGGKILPDQAAALPDATAAADAAASVEAPAVPTAVRIAVPALKALDLPPAETAEPAPAKPAEAAPAPTLARMLAQAVRGPRAADKDPVSADQDAPAADADTDAGEPAVADAAVAIPVLELPALPVIAAATAQAVPVAKGGTSAKASAALPVLPQATAGKTAEAAPQQGQPGVKAAPVQNAPAALAQATAPAVSVLTVPAAPADAAPAVVTVAPAQAPVQPAGQAVTARIKVAAKAGDRQSAASADPAERPAPALRAALADHAPAAAAEPVAPAVPVIADGQAQAAPAAPTASAAPAGLPRHDFAALVDRLIEARNASATNPVHASVNHAEFGRVSLQFQQDGKDLSVSMSSADPEFAVAAQAAMPADRPAANADTGARGQGQSQAQAQAQSDGYSNHEAPGQRGADAAADQQNRNGQPRNPRGGTETSNPSQRWAERERPEARGGIFA